MTAMKKLYLLSGVIVLLAISCVSSKERFSENYDKKKPDESVLRKAVESGRFIVKFERIHSFGGFRELRPRANYLIVDGRRAVINTAYMGRQYDIRPIAAINMRGRTSVYEVTNRFSRGMYDIKMRVENGGNAFDVYLTINKNGNANASVNSLKINNVQYYGYVVPLDEQVKVPLKPENGVI